MPSVTSICNQALSRLGANQIIDIDEDTTEAILCKANYANIRDVVLEEHQWTFAIKRFQLPKVPNDGVNQYGNKYLIPVDVINIIRAGQDKDDRVPNIYGWAIEGEYIVSDSGTMYVKAVTRITNPQLYTPMFIQAVAVRLASELSLAITHSSSLQHALLQEYARLLQLAAQKDGQQGTTQRIRSPRYKVVRAADYGGYYIGP